MRLVYTRALIRSLLSCASFIALIAVGPAIAAAQTGEPAPSPLDRTMPGFAVLDSSVMSVEHVAPLHSTTLKLFSTLRNDDLVPRDLGFEILPWLAKRVQPGSTVEEAYRRQYRPGLAGSVAQYAALSLAVSQHGGSIASRRDPLLAEESFSQLALGIRTFLFWSGRPNSRLASLMSDYDSRRGDLDKAIQDETRPDAGDDEQQRAADLLAIARGVRQDLVRADKNRVGFMLETGTVVALHVPANSLRDSTVARRAWWATPIYRFDRNPTSISAIVRYIDERETGFYIVDMGGRISAVAGGIEYSLESIGRIRSKENPSPDDDLHTGRTIGGVSYAFGRSTQLAFTMGKSYRGDIAGGGSLVASFGVNISLGEMPLGIPQQ